MPLGGSCERGKVLSLWASPSPAGRWVETDRGSEERGAAAFQQRGQREQHRHSRPVSCTPQSKRCMLVHMGAQCWKLGFSQQTQREDWGCLHRDSPKHQSAVWPQLPEGCAEHRQGLLWNPYLNVQVKGRARLLPELWEPQAPLDYSQAKAVLKSEPSSTAVWIWRIYISWLPLWLRW